MYPVSAAFMGACFNHEYMKVDITYTQSGTTKHITNDDIISGGLIIDRYTCSGSKLEIGTAIASQMTLRLYNKDGRFNNVSFAGKELYVTIEVAGETMPVGYYTVDTAPRKQSVITIEALDRMTKFDKVFDGSGITYPTTPNNLLQYICQKVGVTWNIYTITNGTIPISPELDANTTYRTVLQYICELSGNCAYIGADGKLKLGWYSTTPSDDTPQLSKSRRYTSDIYESTTEIDTVLVEYKNKSVQAGSGDYKYTISGNKVLTDQFSSTIVQYIRNDVSIEYTPFTASCLPMPYMYPMDCIKVEKNGSYINTTLTNVRWTLNGKTELKAKGETDTQGNLAPVNMVTGQTKQYVDKETNTVTEFASTISDGLGLTRIEYNGQWYLCNTSSLFTATLIYTINSNGFAYAKGEAPNYAWNNGNPNWQYGIDSNGNIIANTVTADYVNALNITAKKIEVKDTNDNTTFLADATTHQVDMAGWKVTKDYIGSTSGSGSGDNLKSFMLYSVTNTSKDAFIECAERGGNITFKVYKNGSVLCQDLDAQGTISGANISGAINCEDYSGNIAGVKFDNEKVFTKNINVTGNASIGGTTLKKLNGSTTSSTVYFKVGTVSVETSTNTGSTLRARVTAYSDSARTSTMEMPFSQNVVVPVTDNLGNSYNITVPMETGATTCSGQLQAATLAVAPLTSGTPSPASVTSTIYSNGGLSINNNIIPASNSQYDLGSDAKRWSTIYLDNNPDVASDRRLKTDINYDLKDYEGFLDKLKPCSYRFKNEGRTHLGFIAQDVAEANKKNTIVYENEDGMYSMSYAELHAIEVKEIQELRRTIQELKEEIRQLKEEKE